MQGGTIRRTDMSMVLDVFSVMAPESRAAIARHFVPARASFDAVRRQFSGVATPPAAVLAEVKAQLREVELACMAKVWSYPEDMPAVIAGLRARPYVSQLSAAFGRQVERGGSAPHVKAPGGGAGTATPTATPGRCAPF